MRLFRINILSSIISVFILSACQDIYDLEKNTVNHYDLEVDAALKAEVIPNLVSNLNVWNMNDIFRNPSPNEENNIFDFVEYVQLMTATGGSPERDLF